MKLVVIDVETTGLSPDQDEIIEIGAVEWTEDGIGEQFHSLVRPTRPVPESILGLTGMTMSELASAPTLEEVLPRFLAFIEGKPLAGHHVGFDIEFLTHACEAVGYVLPTAADGLDTRDLSRVLFPFAGSHRLQDAAARLGIQVEQSHRAPADALTTARVISGLSQKALALPHLTLQALVRLASLYSAVTGQWLAELADRQAAHAPNALPEGCETIDQLAFRSASSRPTNRPSQTTASEDWTSESERLLAADSPLSAALPGFEVRPGQQKMVTAVADALQQDRHLIAEAGTGTGKSLAYLIPAVLYARRNDTRVVISTHTIALQDQIAERDFPTLRSVIAEPLKLSVFKGRTHYICMRKLRHESELLGWTHVPEEVRAYMRLLVWLTETETGSREELAMTGAEQRVWPRVQSESETCINKRCPFFKPCFYFRARAQAYDADVVVTNHALVMTDLKAENRVLPPYEKLIVDEAHHLEEEATRQLGEEVRHGQIRALLARLVRDHGRQGVLPELHERLTEQGRTSLVADVSELMDICQEFESQLNHAFAALAKIIPPHANELRLTAQIHSHPAWPQYAGAVAELSQLWQRAQGKLSRLADAAAASDDELAGRMLDAVGYFPALGAAIETMDKAQEETPEWVTWIEAGAEVRGASALRNVNLYRTPLDIAPILEERLFAKKSSVVLTSATLSVEGRFSYVTHRLGLANFSKSGRLAEVKVPSPFQLRRQALLCVPNDAPELAKMETHDAALWLAESVYRLAMASRGKMLVLFTSHQLLRATAAHVRDPLVGAGYQLFAQGLDGNRSRLLEAFRQHPHGVLFGAQSFWEGIDLPGDQLRTLVIVRLPFAPPTHPVTKARHEQLEQQGQSAFWHASLPEAVVRFRQGFGRLIRTSSDRGAVICYDRRLVESRYGRVFVRSLDGVVPIYAPESEVIGKVQTFFQVSDACSPRRAVH
ncbi:helicase C-terminal domain-containing protein [Alicyclobacillus shizuokensis]|uniref:helicase C-terminal domain-containing protein n=1 Tax=Alicyclobacillus shizuokensis TaxID=392014 RepID=UPI00082E8FDF|nr:helicase C-terminal domain-containing protein [Alicyclobacillus shizuokensis]